MIPELEAQLANYRKIMKEKKDRKSTNNEAEKVAEEDADDDIEVIDD